ncbi:hypothetical protein [Bradyrhizobium cosmicum]|uniref:hypothetical protein n=1 Tax=Bradyrhizobium cosmicum TaxID=1404864 RepID=UPI0011627D3E|nr:hypothetical protein [Bradyrhizobium cosmicum]QDP24019.1 hypothetical protein FNV92_18475 [Bradyrhizobium cosmicum]
MEFSTGFGWTRLPALAVVFVLGSVLTVSAQIIPPFSPAAAVPDDEAEAAETAEATPDVNDPDVLKGIDVDKLDWSQLAVDAGTASEIAAAKKRAQAAAKDGMDWSSNANANGSSAVTVKQSVSSFWDARIGADMTVTSEPRTMSELLAQKATNGGNVPQSSGSAWAAATAPGAGVIWDKTAVEARVDPGAEQSKIGASLTKSVPLSGDTSLTLQNGYSVNQQGTTALPGVGGHITRNYGTDQSAKVTITDTGTSITAGQTLSTTDDKWLRKVGAEQKLFDNVTVSGSVGETSQGAINKSLSAGFKKSW